MWKYFKEDFRLMWQELKEDSTLMFSFHGFLGRRDFWRGMIALHIITLGTYVACWTIATFAIFVQMDAAKTVALGMTTLALPVSIAGFWSYLALILRRCHALGRTGTWALLGLIPILNMFFVLYLGIKPTRRDANPYLA